MRKNNRAVLRSFKTLLKTALPAYLSILENYAIKLFYFDAPAVCSFCCYLCLFYFLLHLFVFTFSKTKFNWSELPCQNIIHHQFIFETPSPRKVEKLINWRKIYYRLQEAVTFALSFAVNACTAFYDCW
jgi:hypothetical protein